MNFQIRYDVRYTSVVEILFTNYFNNTVGLLPAISSELLKRIELSTSSLPRKCSTPELQQQGIPNSKFKVSNSKLLTFKAPNPKQSSNFEFGILNLKFLMSGRRDSNPRPIAWKAIALPTELLPHSIISDLRFQISELAVSTKSQIVNQQSKIICGENRIRTCEDISQQIYSLSSLAA